MQPLVRNREGKMWCVGCRAWAVREGEAAEAGGASRAEGAERAADERDKGPEAAAGEGAEAAGGAGPEQRCIASAARAVAEKMAEAARELRGAPASDAGLCLSRLRLIRECAGTLAELTSLARERAP